MAEDITSPIAGATVLTEEGEKPIKNTQEQIVEASQNQVFDAQAFESLKNLVSRKTNQGDELQGKIRELSDSLNNIMTNDAALSDAEEELKENRKAVTKRKAQIVNSPESQELKAKIKELKDELRDIEDSLSTQLLNLYQMTGVQEFETNTGEVREFVIKAKVKAKRKKNGK